MLEKRDFWIKVNIVLIVVWGLLTIWNIITYPAVPVTFSMVMLYACYVMAECNEIKRISEDDRYDD